MMMMMMTRLLLHTNFHSQLSMFFFSDFSRQVICNFNSFINFLCGLRLHTKLITYQPFSILTASDHIQSLINNFIQPMQINT